MFDCIQTIEWKEVITMFKCSGKDAKCLCDQLECDVKETGKGIQVDIKAKDASKTKSLKTLIKAFHDFCGCR